MKTKTVREKADDRKRIADDIRDQFGGVSAICASQARRYLGMGEEMGNRFLRELESFQLCKGGKRMYLAIDIARKIYERQGA